MSEHALQVAVARMLELVLDPQRTWWTAIDHAAKLGARYGADRKRRGVKRGIPDFLILSLHHIAVGIELKTDKGRLSPEQREVHAAWDRFHHPVYVARSLEDVHKILEQCYVPMVRRMTFFGEPHGHPPRAPRARHPGTRRRRKPKNNLPVLQRRSAKT